VRYATKAEYEPSAASQHGGRMRRASNSSAPGASAPCSAGFPKPPRPKAGQIPSRAALEDIWGRNHPGPALGTSALERVMRFYTPRVGPERGQMRGVREEIQLLMSYGVAATKQMAPFRANPSGRFCLDPMRRRSSSIAHQELISSSLLAWDRGRSVAGCGKVHNTL